MWRMRLSSDLLLLYRTMAAVFIITHSTAVGCPANKSVLLFENAETAALSAAVDDAISSFLPCPLSLQHQARDKGSLEVLVEVLKDGELEDTIAVLHPGDTEDIGVIAQLLNTNTLSIPLITYSFPLVSLTPLLPYYVQMVPSEMSLPQAVQTIIEEYGWTRAAILTQDNSVFIALRDEVLSLWEFREVNVVHQLLVDPTELPKMDLFADDVRIFILNMNFELAREVLCEARLLTHYSSYVWITYGWFEGEWWMNGTSECTASDLEGYLDGSLTVSHFPFLQNDLTGLNGSESERERLVIDALQAAALVFNDSLPNSTDLSKDLFDNLSFTGASGPVGFTNGIRRRQEEIRISQYRKDKKLGVLKRTVVALVNLNAQDEQASANFTYLTGENESTVWPGGVPSDGTPIQIQHYPFLALMVLIYLFAVAGLIFTFICLIFNIVFRDRKLIRLSSPTLNYLIILGAALLYLSSMGFFYPPGSPSTYITALCTLRTFGASFGYSFAYGTINAKMWRVYYICTKAKPTIQGVPLKDWHLILVVVVLVLVDSLIAVIVLPLDNARASAFIIPNKQDPGFTRNSDGIKEVSVVSRCTAPVEPYWLGVLFGYKIIFQAIGVFLAFKIRKVKIRGLNESREVSAILYITSAILATMILVTFVLSEYIDVEAVVFGVGLCIATSVVLALTFGTKMWGLYKDPEGKNVLKGTVASTNGGVMDIGSAGARGSNEVAAMQAKIRELEHRLKQASVTPDQNTISASTGSE